jgi:hypothetical protein
MSEFVWLDYSERERRKMLDVVDLFREHDTRDELGIGSVRDTFADLFFPGTSTIMTRARYFLLVAWTYQRLEKQRIGSDQIVERARRACFAGKYREICHLRLVMRDPALALPNKFKVYPPNSLRIEAGNFAD